MTELLGLFIIYTWVHFIVILAVEKKEYKDRTSYEKFVSIAAITGAVLCFIGLIMR